MKNKTIRFSLLMFVTIPVFLIGMSSCSHSNFSKHFVQTDQLVMKGGISENKKWDDELVFQRNSLYQELSLIYDILATKISADSPFINWFSARELEEFNKCQSFILWGYYVLEDNRVRIRKFESKLEEAGAEKVNIYNLISYLKLHPDFSFLNLQLHNFYGSCFAEKDVKELEFFFPNFRKIKFSF